MGKYTYHPDLKPYAKLNIPVVPALLPLMQKALGLLFRAQRSGEGVAVERRSIPARDGWAIPALLYVPEACPAGGPCMIFYHGGGFVYPGAPHHYKMARRFARLLGIKVLYVDYRLAPKYTFPKAVEDAYDAYAWLLDHAGELGVDPGRVVLCGDSAGGNLCAVTCLMARDGGRPMPRGQVLLYPFVDRNMESESMLRFTDTPLCNSLAGKKFNAVYGVDGELERPEYFSAVEASSFADHPPTYVEVAELDCLRDGGLLYEARLRAAGVDTRLRDVKAAMHGYDIAADSALVRGLMEERVAFVKEILREA